MTLYLKSFLVELLLFFLISIAKLYDNLLGNNNAILFNSDYYRMVLVFGVILAISAVVLNIILIPLYGINGSAIATLIAVVVYNTIKVVFVKMKFNMLPFTKQTLKISVLTYSLCILHFIIWEFPFNAYALILFMKSILIGLVYAFLIYKFKISEDINDMFNKYLKLKK